jgi:enterochelin esterase-like enzyme
MALAEFHFTSNNSLQRQMSAMIIVPEKKPGPFPVLYLLHGLSDDHTAWTRFSNVEMYVQSLPLIVVMPDTERGWYVDALHDPGKKFESMIIDDLVPFVDGAFRTTAAAEGRAIAGLSMGGYGALTLALKHPDMFCAAHGFSSGFARGGVAPKDEESRLVGFSGRHGLRPECARRQSEQEETATDYVRLRHRRYDARLESRSRRAVDRIVDSAHIYGVSRQA